MSDPCPPEADDSDPVTEPEEHEDGPHRRCIGSGIVQDKDTLIRFVVGPGQILVPDLAARLPGRGLYLTPSRAIFAQALKKKAFARAARGPITVPEDLPVRLDRLLCEMAQQMLGMARRSGQAVAGYDQAAHWLRSGKVGLLVQAADAAEGGRARLRALAGQAPERSVLRSAELGGPFGRDHLVHVAVARGGLAQRIRVALDRLAGWREGMAEQEVAER